MLPFDFFCEIIFSYYKITSFRHPSACSGETKRKFESVHSGGTMNTPDSGKVLQYWHCCGSEDPFDPGCTAAPHFSYDDWCSCQEFNIHTSYWETLRCHIISPRFMPVRWFTFILVKKLISVGFFVSSIHDSHIFIWSGEGQNLSVAASVLEFTIA